MSDPSILLALFVSSSWVFSRWTAPQDAWRPPRIDTVVGIVFFASWVANAIGIFTQGTLADAANESTVIWFWAIVGVIVAYVALIWTFGKIRIGVYNWNHD